MVASDWQPAPLCHSASLAEAPEHPEISHNATRPPAAVQCAQPPEERRDGAELRDIQEHMSIPVL